MNIRVMGVSAEVDAVVAALKACPRVRVLAVRGPYPNRGDDVRVRVYLAAVVTSPEVTEP